MQNTHWTIAQPCHVPLNKMAVSDKGYFCHSCQKNVYDLSQIKTVPTESICGYTVEQKAPSVSSPGRWSVFLLRWLGVMALFFIPLKKGKTSMPAGISADPAGENKKAFGPKRIMGTVLDAAKRPVRTTVQVKDMNGTILAEARSMINGRYMVVLDTPAIDTPRIAITALDTTAYNISLGTSVVINYPKDSFWIHQDIVVMAGVCPQIITQPQINLQYLYTDTDTVKFYLGTAKTLESAAIGGAQNMIEHKS